MKSLIYKEIDDNSIKLKYAQEIKKCKCKNNLIIMSI